MLETHDTIIPRYRRLLPVLSSPKRGPKRKYDPTEVLQKLADGSTVQNIAREYAIRPSSMRTTLHILMQDHKVVTITQLVAHYLRNGWID